MHDGGGGHQHQMTQAMLRVENEQMWFARVAVAVILFNVIHAAF
jgi:hypothetical protein